MSGTFKGQPDGRSQKMRGSSHIGPGGNREPQEFMGRGSGETEMVRAADDLPLPAGG